MEERILKTDYWKTEKNNKSNNIKTRMSEEIAKNISNNLLMKKRNNNHSNSKELSSKANNINPDESLFVKSREISFNNTFTHHTLGSEMMNSAGKYTSFGDSISKKPVNSLIREKNFISYSKETKNNAWSKNSQKLFNTSKKDHISKDNISKIKPHDDSMKENINILNSNIIRSNFTLNPENEYDTKKEQNNLTQVIEESSDYSSILTTDKPNATRKKIFSSKEPKNNFDNSTISSTINSKMGLSPDNPFNQKTRRFSNSLRDFDSKKIYTSSNVKNRDSNQMKFNGEYYKDFGQKTGESNNKIVESHRKTQSKNYNKSNLVKNLILNKVPIEQKEPIHVYNIQVQPLKNKIVKEKREGQRKQAGTKKKRKKRNRGEISDKVAFVFAKEVPDKRSIDMPNIRTEMKRIGLTDLKNKCQSEIIEKDSSLTKRAVKTEKLNFDSKGFGFSKRNLISIEGESQLNINMDDNSLSRHNKFIKNSRKQRSNIKIKFGQSLTPKKKIINKNVKHERVDRKSKSIGGKKLFETMEDRGIYEEVRKRMQKDSKTKKFPQNPRVNKTPVMIRTHDDMMKKSVDFINGIDVSSMNGQGSLVESILKKKEISNISLDYSGM
jgi:hypothetical protein